MRLVVALDGRRFCWRVGRTVPGLVVRLVVAEATVPPPPLPF